MMQSNLVRHDIFEAECFNCRFVAVFLDRELLVVLLWLERLLLRLIWNGIRCFQCL